MGLFLFDLFSCFFLFIGKSGQKYAKSKHQKGRSVPRVSHVFAHVKDFVVFLFLDTFFLQKVWGPTQKRDSRGAPNDLESVWKQENDKILCDPKASHTGGNLVISPVSRHFCIKSV